MSLTQKQLNDLERAQERQLRDHLEDFAFDEEEGDEETAIERYWDSGDARLEEERERRYRDEEET